MVICCQVNKHAGLTKPTSSLYLNGSAARRCVKRALRVSKRGYGSMPEDSTELHAFLDALRVATLARTRAREPAGRVIGTIFQALDAPIPTTTNEPSRLPVCRHLETAFATACEGLGPPAHAARALRSIEPMFTWWMRPGADAVGPIFANGHANATVVGPTGLVQRGDVQIGVSLLAPGIQYPDHQHLPEEVYLVLSPGEWRHADGPWQEPGMGGIVHNPPDIVHAMRSKDGPLLAVWCLL